MTPLTRSILSIALPSVAANITAPLLGLVDMAIVGHMGNAACIGAIALGGTMFSMLYWIFAFLRMGTGGLVAQAFGRHDRPGMSAAFSRAVLVAAACGVVLIALSPLLCGWLLRVMAPEEGTAVLAARYFRILIWGAPAFLTTYALNGWFVGCQSTQRALWMSIVINVVNIAASLVFVYVFGMGIDGVALGTLTAQWAGCIFGMAMARRMNLVKVGFRTLLAGRELKRFFSLNFDIFLRTLCLVAVTVWFTSAGARQGDMILAANALLMQFFLLVSYIMDGVSYAGEALAGSAFGQSDYRRLRAVVGGVFRIGAAVGLVFTLVYFFAGDLLLNLLSDNESVTEAAKEFRWWAVSVPFAGFSAFLWDGIFIGATMTRRMLLSMAVSAAVFFATYFALSPAMGNHALWLAFILYLASRGILQTVLWARWLRQR